MFQDFEIITRILIRKQRLVNLLPLFLLLLKFWETNKQINNNKHKHNEPILVYLVFLLERSTELGQNAT
jgi:hypothetical protein